MYETRTQKLKDFLVKHTKVGELYRSIGNNTLECFACGHRCKIKDGRDGICRIRFNRNGKLYTPYGYFAGVHLDPIEKKPFFHALPGSYAMSFGMLGCCYHCSFCQNWISSQVLRDPNAFAFPDLMTPEDFILLASEYKAKIVTSTYNEPLITSEWAVEIFKLAKKHGLVTSYVSNGNATPEVIDYLKPWLDLFKIDLKGFNDKRYRQLGGVLKNVLDTIKLLYEKKFWIEVVTLIVPGFNDSESELRDIANFLVKVSPDIPWHVTAFHSDYKMSRVGSTPINKLVRAAEIGFESGLHYVYAGNIPGHVGNLENTYCPNCKELLIERLGFKVKKNTIIDGSCPKCNYKIAGFWNIQTNQTLNLN